MINLYDKSGVIEWQRVNPNVMVPVEASELIEDVVAVVRPGKRVGDEIGGSRNTSFTCS